MLQFHIGQKVVCINDDLTFPEEHFAPGENVKRGEIYTIVNMFMPSDNSELILEFAEKYQPGDAFWYPGYLASYFRPVTDISVFTEMLKQRELIA